MVAFSEVYRGTLKNQRKNLLKPSLDLTGTTVIVTGANAGLGKEVTTKLALMNPSKVVRASFMCMYDGRAKSGCRS